MALGIAINGQKLHEVTMPQEPYYNGVVSSLGYPKSRIKFSLEEDSLRLAIPPLLGMELYRSGILPQDTETPVTIAIGGRREGQFTVIDVRYPGHGGYSDDVKITFRRCK
jgi:hypothetical protein